MSTVDTVRAAPPSYLYYRHTVAVRIMHWINVIALTVLLMSGLNIFSAHPALYWGTVVLFATPAAPGDRRDGRRRQCYRA